MNPKTLCLCVLPINALDGFIALESAPPKAVVRISEQFRIGAYVRSGPFKAQFVDFLGRCERGNCA